jgi:hypothetical protein
MASSDASPYPRRAWGLFVTMSDTYRARKEEWVSNHTGCPSWEAFVSIGTIPVRGQRGAGRLRCRCTSMRKEYAVAAHPADPPVPANTRYRPSAG